MPKRSPQEAHLLQTKKITMKNSLATHVEDCPGHDFRYAFDSSRIESELGWEPDTTFEEGIYKTVQWYLTNKGWWSKILNQSYMNHKLLTD